VTGAGALQLAGFGDPGGALWGAAVAWTDAQGPDARGLIAGGDRGRGRAEALERWRQDGERWSLAGAGLALEIAPASQRGAEGATVARGAARGARARLELCRARARLDGPGAGRELDCDAVLATLEPPAEGGVSGSARLVAGWLARGESFALVAVRPPGAAFGEGELIAAALSDSKGVLEVSEPRLSTTYDGEGRPTRTNLELWIGEGEAEYPRRAAGEASGPAVVLKEGGWRLVALPLACHSRGLEGAGVYLLAERL